MSPVFEIHICSSVEQRLTHFQSPVLNGKLRVDQLGLSDVGLDHTWSGVSPEIPCISFGVDVFASNKARTL